MAECPGIELDRIAGMMVVSRLTVPFRDPARWREELVDLGIDPDALQFGQAPPPGHRWETDREFAARLAGGTDG